LLNKNKQLTIKGIFTHLASSEDSSKDSFTQDQLKEFHLIYETICEKISYRPIKHSNNSSASIRFGSEGDNDMVRLGIALYGIDPSKTISDELLPVFEFKTHISQIKTVRAGDGIGYGSFSVSTSNRKIAILAVGYADGFNRSFSQGNHYVMINNKKAYTVGNICMDMCMVDISHIDCEEGDEVELFGKQIPISLWSKTLNTIPYEILTSISQRVKRIFIAEN
jgi:alanine racemase